MTTQPADSQPLNSTDAINRVSAQPLNGTDATNPADSQPTDSTDAINRVSAQPLNDTDATNPASAQPTDSTDAINPASAQPPISTEPPPSYVKLAMRNMVRKRGTSLFHFALTTAGLLAVLVGLAYITR